MSSVWGLLILTFGGCKSLRLGVVNFYVRGLYLLRLGVVSPYVWGL